MLKKILIVSAIIYSYFFYKLGNTIYRMDSNSIYQFSLEPLITEGFIGPIRTLIYLLIHQSGLGNKLSSVFIFLSHEIFRLSNPFSAFIFTYYIISIIKENFIQRD